MLSMTRTDWRGSQVRNLPLSTVSSARHFGGVVGGGIAQSAPGTKPGVMIFGRGPLLRFDVWRFRRVQHACALGDDADWRSDRPPRSTIGSGFSNDHHIAD